MNRKEPNQSDKIKAIINELLDPPYNITDKQAIYTKVQEHSSGPYPRPTVRRVAGELRNELVKKIKILQSEAQQTIIPSV